MRIFLVILKKLNKRLENIDKDLIALLIKNYYKKRQFFAQKC